MKKIMKFFIYLLLMLALIILFLPKINLYYAAEVLMKEKNIYISDEDIMDKGYSLELVNANLLFENLALAEVKKIELSFLVLYNVLSLDNIHVNEGFSDFLPQEIKSVRLEHFMYDPMMIKLKGESGESRVYGDIDLLDRVLTLHLRLDAKSEKKYGALLSKLTKEEGGYIYDYKF